MTHFDKTLFSHSVDDRLQYYMYKIEDEVKKRKADAQLLNDNNYKEIFIKCSKTDTVMMEIFDDMMKDQK